MNSNKGRHNTCTVSSSLVGGEGRDLSSRHGLQFCEDSINPLVLLPIGIHRLATTAQRQGEHQHSVGGGVHRLDQIGEEGGELLSSPASGRTPELAQIDGQLVHEFP